MLYLEGIYLFMSGIYLILFCVRSGDFFVFSYNFNVSKASDNVIINWFQSLVWGLIH